MRPHNTRRAAAAFLPLFGLFCLGFLPVISCAGGQRPAQQPAVPETAKPAGQSAAPAAPAQPSEDDARKQRIEELNDTATLLDKGNSDAAVAKLDQMAAADPQNSKLKMLKASALVSGGKIKEARALMDNLLAGDPSNIEALAFAAGLARFDSDTKAQKAFLDKGLAVAPADASILSAWGQYCLDLRDWTKAEDYYRKAVAADPKNPDAALGLGEALYDQYKYKEAEKILDQAVSLEPSAFAYSARAKALQQQGKHEAAIADLDKAIAKAPEFSWLYLDRGRDKLSMNDRKGAEADISEAIKLEPDYFLPYVYRAGIYEETSQDDKAIADYEKILAIQPDYWYAWESRGAAAYRIELWDKAAESFQKAYSYASNRYEYAILAGLALMRSGKTQAAKTWASKIAPAINRDTDNMYWLMLRLIQDQNDKTSEIEVSVQNEKKLDNKAAMLFYLGEYWRCRGRPAIAANYFNLAKEMNRAETLEYRLLLPELKSLDAGR